MDNTIENTKEREKEITKISNEIFHKFYEYYTELPKADLIELIYLAGEELKDRQIRVCPDEEDELEDKFEDFLSFTRFDIDIH